MKDLSAVQSICLGINVELIVAECTSVLLCRLANPIVSVLQVSEKVFTVQPRNRHTDRESRPGLGLPWELAERSGLPRLVLCGRLTLPYQVMSGQSGLPLLAWTVATGLQVYMDGLDCLVR